MSDGSNWNNCARFYSRNLLKQNVSGTQTFFFSSFVLHRHKLLTKHSASTTTSHIYFLSFRICLFRDKHATTLHTIWINHKSFYIVVSSRSLWRDRIMAGVWSCLVWSTGTILMHANMVQILSRNPHAPDLNAEWSGLVSTFMGLSCYWWIVPIGDIKADVIKTSLNVPFNVVTMTVPTLKGPVDLSVRAVNLILWLLMC